MSNTKKKITSDEAVEMMFDTLNKESIEDRIYEFADDLFGLYIDRIEKENEITDNDEFGNDEEWYDEIRDEFLECVYDKVRSFLKS